MTTDNTIFSQLFEAAQQPINANDMAAWYGAFKCRSGGLSNPIDRALLGGVVSHCVGYAFVAGYQSAIEHLFAQQDQRLSSLCVTEAKGNHPRAIHCALRESDDGEHWLLDGAKQFVSGAEDAERLFVACTYQADASAAKHDTESARPDIRIVQVELPHEGVKIEALPELKFIPEVSHGKVAFHQVKVAKTALLAGDGYTDFVKPFRTAEDIHVLGAILAYRFGLGVRQQWPRVLLEEHLALLTGLRALAAASLQSPVSHLQLAGLRHQLGALIETSDHVYAREDAEGFEDWKRDRALLKVALTAHEKRTSNAWEVLGA